MTSDMSAKVSIILPAYNAAKYIAQAIQSVIIQTYTHWELLIINDGSTDNTEAEAIGFNDHRIRYFSQNNEGVSAARNVGLANMKGDYFCFLDADDVMPPKSLENRLKIFAQDSTLSFVDGNVLIKEVSLNNTIREYKPSFKGHPFSELIKLSEKCFFGPSWMIKRDRAQSYRFLAGVTHNEDLLFYISIAENKLYSFTTEDILYYRQTTNSAMSNLRGLEEGYYRLYISLKNKYDLTTQQLLYLKYKITRIMTLSYIYPKYNLLSALRVFIRFIKL